MSFSIYTYIGPEIVSQHFKDSTLENQKVHHKTISLWLLENYEGDRQNSSIMKHVENPYCMRNVGCSNLRQTFVTRSE